ncbi:stearoyl-CoA 9-desaturase [Polyrhizophydium stewartii]|uniref:Acyl-CoA desaturase n=1 Tax=Polyrhizophydium stewartii TaxID=2732419 RepID=A0ABR4NAA7_9FUNG
MPSSAPKQPRGLAAVKLPFLPLTLGEINWVHLIMLSITPLIALYGFLTVPLLFKTFVFAFLYYNFSGFGITVGYHRYWSHRSYEASRPFQFVMALAGASAVQGSIRWWSRGHRAHHRYTDTPKDPYSARKGVFWSHLGWLLVKTDYSTVGRVDISDLNSDPVVMWQNRNYALIAVLMSLVIPTAVPGLLWGDWAGGYFYAAVARQVFVHHATFCVNSLAHWLGDAPYDDRHTPRDNIITALITFGEGYHNFHHEFPSDYRNAIGALQYDPSKWIIYLSSLIGQTWALQTFSQNEIEKGRLTMAQKLLDRKRAQLKWGPSDAELPSYTFEQFQRMCRDEGRMLFVIDNGIYDVADFLDKHPGGRGFLKASIGKDVTVSFNGGVYDHHNAARNLASMMRVGLLKDSVPEQFVAREE